MTSLTDRVAAAQKQADATEAEKRFKLDAERDYRTITALNRLESLLLDELQVAAGGAMTFGRVLRYEPANKQEGSEYATVEIEGFTFGIQMPRSWRDDPEAQQHRVSMISVQPLVVLPTCNNGHPEYERYPVAPHSSWDTTLLSTSNRQNALRVEGGCPFCVKEGKTRSLKQRVLDSARSDPHLAQVIVQRLVQHTYSDDTLIQILNSL